MKPRPQASRQTTLDLFEEAMHLLRRAPAVCLGWYYLGALPFILVLLYFWTDMSWSAEARRDCAVNAFFVALAFAWMKFCQAVSAQELRAQLRLESSPQLTFGQMLRIALQQAIIQPSKLFVLPVAFVVTLPFGWVCAFYENVTAFGEAESVRVLCSKAWKQARLWPRQNHLALAIFALWALLMSFNVLLLSMIAPHFLKLFTGSENVFTRSGMHVLNSTSLAVVGLVTYLCCDPLLKTIYVLRCFYGEALQSGEDLQVELRRLRRVSTAAFSLALFFLVTCLPASGATPAFSPPTTINAQQLDRSIEETITEPEFRWRMPRESEDEVNDSTKSNAFDRFLHRSLHTLGKWWRSFLKWLDRIMPGPSMPTEKSGNGNGAVGFARNALEFCLVILGATLAVVLGLKIRNYYRLSPSQVSALPQVVDLAQEDVTADQLPEDEWLRLARDLIQKGDWRLAVRAFFLAGLAHLSQREMIALARHKSNRDYQTELRRRAPTAPDLQDAFARNLREVERTWYGRHQINEDTLESFQRNLETIRAA